MRAFNRFDDIVVKVAGGVKRWMEDQAYAIMEALKLDDDQYEEVFEWVMDNYSAYTTTKKIVNEAKKVFASSGRET